MELVDDYIRRFKNIETTTEGQENARKEFILTLEDFKLNPESYGDVKGCINNVLDECHDGAYVPEETNEPFTEDDVNKVLISFIKKRNFT
jgi:hypothetical protein